MNGKAVSPEAVLELERIEQNGALTPEAVILSAMSEKSPLHDYFIWDDSLAAKKYRIEQARGLIRSVKIEITVEDRTFRCVKFVQTPTPIPNQSEYVDLHKVLQSNAVAVMQREVTALIGHVTRAFEIATDREKELPATVADDLALILAMLENTRDVIGGKV